MAKKDEGAASVDAAGAEALARKHLRWGWWSVLVFLALGIGLEAMHGLKVDWYLNVRSETRRLMLTLGHSHGALIGVLHLAFAYSATALPKPPSRLASHCLTASGVLLPAGFLLGGWVVYGGDPGKGVVLVPIGAGLLLVAVLLTALRATRG
ncbi:MAG: hypothetical protein H6828_02465 [Planctomycetes bacterium]|nr:hypothetical protein [Planctomycetota bacterium]